MPFMFEGIFALFPIIFLLVLGFIIFQILRNVGESISNSQKPRETAHVQVLDKRAHVWSSGSMHHSGTGIHHGGGSRTSYYVTFQFENGERREYIVPARLYGQIVAGDVGTLTWQGTAFREFQRIDL